MQRQVIHMEKCKSLEKRCQKWWPQNSLQWDRNGLSSGNRDTSEKQAEKTQGGEHILHLVRASPSDILPLLVASPMHLGILLDAEKHTKYSREEPREMTQWLRECTTTAVEGWSSIPSTHSRWLMTDWTPASRGSNTPGLHGQQCSCTHTRTETHTHMHN